MDLFDRSYCLDRVLRQSRYPVPHAVLQEKLECSRATTNRIIRDMRNYLDAPIQFDRNVRFRRGGALAPTSPWNPLLGCSLLRNHGNSINLHKKIWVCQCWHKDTGNDGWIRTLAPYFLKRLESGLGRLALQDIDVPLYDVLKAGPTCRKSCLKIS